MGPGFLTLPTMPGKPRGWGRTHVLDKGLTPGAAAATLESAGEHIDVWKFGWGIAYVDPGLNRKLRLLRAHQVSSCLGGTLLEIAWSQGKADECLAWAESAGFDAVEVSRGVVEMTLDDKRDLIKKAGHAFTVFAETGVKNPAAALSAAQWQDEIAEDLAAGATWIVTEGRESGTVGIYDDSGRPRQDIIQAAVSAAGVERVMFEAPRTAQQAWLINRFGPAVNLANIAPGDVLPLATLRLGLRADTAALSVDEPP
ncbi:phosphosulfolactate synthase [Nonomuraea sediminis]|uniref:phosphosulfolactate synthase n=1 Tax=Nonomuraea sediminis TaxID=2835864 RepID=UPI001BDD0318|nr:phosphosulfolactate synthase [Nonomuraea sediminis]